MQVVLYPCISKLYLAELPVSPKMTYLALTRLVGSLSMLAGCMESKVGQVSGVYCSGDVVRCHLEEYCA